MMFSPFAYWNNSGPKWIAGPIGGIQNGGIAYAPGNNKIISRQTTNTLLRYFNYDDLLYHSNGVGNISNTSPSIRMGNNITFLRGNSNISDRVSVDGGLTFTNYNNYVSGGSGPSKIGFFASYNQDKTEISFTQQGTASYKIARGIAGYSRFGPTPTGNTRLATIQRPGSSDYLTAKYIDNKQVIIYNSSSLNLDETIMHGFTTMPMQYQVTPQFFIPTSNCILCVCGSGEFVNSLTIFRGVAPYTSGSWTNYRTLNISSSQQLTTWMAAEHNGHILISNVHGHIADHICVYSPDHGVTYSYLTIPPDLQVTNGKITYVAETPDGFVMVYGATSPGYRLIRWNV